ESQWRRRSRISDSDRDAAPLQSSIATCPLRQPRRRPPQSDWSSDQFRTPDRGFVRRAAAPAVRLRHGRASRRKHSCRRKARCSTFSLLVLGLGSFVTLTLRAQASPGSAGILACISYAVFCLKKHSEYVIV